MNREDIIRMAREAGIDVEKDTLCRYEGWVEPIERFATLVAEAEREKVAQWMIQRSYATGHGDTTDGLLAELDWQIKERIAAEREDCAKVLDEMADYMESEMEPSEAVAWVRSKAASIRARGQA